MQIHQLQPKTKRKKRKRVGRDKKRGNYCGRGIKGQKARAGRKLQPIIRQILKKYPKLRGYEFSPQKKEMAIVNLEILEKKFQEGEIITPQSLLEKKVIKKIKGKVPPVKILAKGEIKKPLKVRGCLLSASAFQKIKKAGGEVIEEK